MAQQDQADRTERPTSRRIREARERGQVARSRDLASAISLAGVVIALGWFGARVIRGMATRLATGLDALAVQGHAAIDGQTLAHVLWSDGALFASIVAPAAVGAAVASIGGSLLQTGWVSSPKALQLNWNRLNPATGFARFSPKQALPELGKALAGVAVLAGVAFVVIHESVNRSMDLMAMAPVPAAREGWSWIARLLFRSTLVLVGLAGLDYGVQRWHWFTSLKMTRREIVDEQKMNEGNPAVKGKIRRLQLEMTRRRMLQAVKTATVVVVNPTHYAVALRYERQVMAAPLVVAKGKDLLAARIRTVAREHGVPIVENVALARALYKGAEVGDTIPAALFGAVAELLAYLVRLKQLIL